VDNPEQADMPVDETGLVPPPGPVPPAPPHVPPPKKASRAWLWILLGVIAALIVVAIVLIATLPADTTQVPDLKGLSLTDGVAALEGAGLKLGRVAYIFELPAGIEEGQIVSQKPVAGGETAKGSPVDVVVAVKTAVTVPDVRGMAVDEAAAALGAVGLEVNSTEVANDAAPGTVVDQSPAPGTSAAPGSLVTVTVSAGAAVSLVPNVVGMTQDDASAALVAAGYQVESNTAYDEQVAKGMVLSQSPEAGTAADPETVVTITVSNGKNPEVKVPNVVGKTETDAAKVLQDAGFEPLPGPSFSDTVAVGTVISQDPQADASAPAGSAVSISISQGPKPPATAVVPNVVGKTETEATNILKSAGYAVVSARTYSDTVAVDVVGGQAPLAGNVTLPGITVGIIVSDGPRPGPDFATVPDVRGMTLEAATAALEQAGLQVSSSEFFTQLAPQGEVFAQLPPPGYPVAPGSAVLVIVSKGPYPQVNPL
jgi:beta-lactam-binding protein with PASTA domain